MTLTLKLLCWQCQKSFDRLASLPGRSPRYCSTGCAAAAKAVRRALATEAAQRAGAEAQAEALAARKAA